jgi:hypothetical protein
VLRVRAVASVELQVTERLLERSHCTRAAFVLAKGVSVVDDAREVVRRPRRLAGRVPVLRDQVERGFLADAVISEPRRTLIGAVVSTLPLIATSPASTHAMR